MRKTILAVFLLGCLTGALATKLGVFEQLASAQTGPATRQDVLGPGLYVFQNRLDRATCGDASGSGFVNSYVAAVNGIPHSTAMHMDLPDSQYWPDWELNVTSTKPFRTDTPNSAMNPTPAEMLKGMSRNHSATTPPTMAKGMLKKMRSAGRTAPNASHSRNRMSSSASGTTTRSRCLASVKC